MVRNLFQLFSFHTSTNDNNSGGKIIQFRDHKHKPDHKKQKVLATRGHNDSLARNMKNQQTLRYNNNYKALSRTKKKFKSKLSLASMLFYAFAVCSILFGIFILFGGISLFIK